MVKRYAHNECFRTLLFKEFNVQFSKGTANLNTKGAKAQYDLNSDLFKFQTYHNSFII